MDAALSVTNWMRKPFSPDMDVWRWVLFVVLILIICAGWSHTVRFIAKVAE